MTLNNITSIFKDKKALSGGIAGVLAWGITQLAKAYFGLELDGQTQLAIAGGIGYLITALVPSSKAEAVERVNDLIKKAAIDPDSPVTREDAKSAIDTVNSSVNT